MSTAGIDKATVKECTPYGKYWNDDTMKATIGNSSSIYQLALLGDIKKEESDENHTSTPTN